MSEKEIPKELLDILVCPKDKAKVEKNSDGNLRCTKCSTIYKVIDGIPVMLVDEEIQNTDTEGASQKKNKSGEEKKEIKLKPHPLLTEKPGPEIKRSNLKQIEKNAVDPFLRIVSQHEKNKLRIAKTTAIIFALMIILFFLYLFANRLKEQAKLNEKIQNFAQKISDCRKTIADSEGYDRASAALAAIVYIERLKQIDWKNEEEWEEKKAFFSNVILEEARPESGKNFVCPTGNLDMVNIPQGVFPMGASPNDVRASEIEVPRRNVIINYEFWVSRTEITNLQFRLAYPFHRIEPWAGQKLDGLFQPAAMLDWHMAMTFCRTITDKEQKAGRLPKNYEYRLPTEAEWEYFARAGTTTIFFWGDEFGNEGAKYANTFDIATSKIHKWRTEKGMAQNDGFIASSPVASFKPNAFGLYDTCGNVWEWCYDWFNPTAYKDLPVISPVQTTPVMTDIEMRGPFDKIYYIDGTARVLRGGSWGNLPSKCRSSHRDCAVPETRNTGIGFRVVLAPTIEKLTESAKSTVENQYLKTVK